MTTKRIIMLAAVGALATVSTVAISVSSWIGASAAGGPQAVRLHLGTDGQYFAYGTTGTYPPDVKQDILVGKNSCAIANAVSQQLINLTSLPSGGNKPSAPGLANYGLGVKESSSSGNGNPCAQIIAGETLSLTLGSNSVVAGRNFTKVQLDLEITGNGIAKLTLAKSGDPTRTHTFTLQTGTNIDAAQKAEGDYDIEAPYVVYSDLVPDVNGNVDDTDGCAKPNSSGPNSAGNDNCEWHVDPGYEFDTISMTSTVGTVTIEGAGDFANDAAHESLFFLGASTPIANDDSAEVNKNTSSTIPRNFVTIDVLHNDTDADGDPLTIHQVADPDPHGTIQIVTDSGVEKLQYTPNDGFVGVETFTYKAFDGTSESNSATVRVRVCSTGTEVIASGNVTANFTRLTELLACKSNTVRVDANASTVLFQPDGDNDSVIASYRGFISFGPKPQVLAPNGAIQLLLQYDPLGGIAFRAVPWCDNPVFDSTGKVTNATVQLPDTWCIASESTVGSGTDSAITTWQVFGRDDPNFR